MSKFHKFMSASSIIALMATETAFAQQVYEDEVIVTATKRAQSVQDIPIAVTAIQPEQLAKQGVVNIQNLTSVAPSFSTSNAQTSSGTVVLRIRGVGTTSNNIGFESAVGVFVDGAYQSRPGVALGEFVDVERVEVLRGPQGTLFGRNTSAGALNVTNVKPQIGESGGFINATAGNYEHFSLQGAANIPISDNMAARVTGAIRNREGYVKVYDGNGQKLGTSNGTDQHMIRAQLAFEGDSGFEGRLIADYAKSTAECCSGIEVMQAPIETARFLEAVGLGRRGGMAGPDVAIGANDEGAVQDAVDNLIATSNQVPNPSNDQIGLTAELKYPVSDNADLVYVGSYREYDATEEYDSGFSGLDIFNVLDGSTTDIDTMTHELRLQGDAMDGRLSWLVGGYYSDEDINQTTRFGLGEDYGELVGALFSNAFGPNPLTLLSDLYEGGGLDGNGFDPSVVRTSNAYTQNSESLSIFTHNVFDVTDQLSLTVGLRYSDESKDGSFSQPLANNPLCPSILSGVQLTPDANGIPQFSIPPAPSAFFANVIGVGCFAFTAPADLPQARPGSYSGMNGEENFFLPLPRSFASKFEDDELIYTGKVSYEFSPDVTAYAGFTHGYKSGGFNLDSTAAVAGADPSFASEEVDAYEVGLKTRLGDITLNIAAFLEEFSDFQVLEFTGAQFQTFNVDKAETRGVEIEASGHLSDNLSFNSGLTLLKAEYPDDCAPSTAALRVRNLCGFTLTNAPKTVGILGATYEDNLNSSLDFFLNGQVRYEGDRRTSTQGRLVPTTEADLGNTPLNPYDVQDGTWKINVRAGIGDLDDVWALEAWATNLTNEVTRGVTFNTVLRGGRSTFVQEPRMYGVTARRNF